MIYRLRELNSKERKRGDEATCGSIYLKEAKYYNRIECSKPCIEVKYKRTTNRMYCIVHKETFEVLVLYLLTQSDQYKSEKCKHMFALQFWLVFFCHLKMYASQGSRRQHLGQPGKRCTHQISKLRRLGLCFPIQCLLLCCAYY